MATFEDLHTYLATMIREPYAHANKWTTAERDLFLNQGKKQTEILTKCNFYSDTFGSTASTSTYTLNTGTITHHIFDIDDHKGVKYAGIRLNRKYESELDREQSDWATVSGTPTNYLFNYDTLELDLDPIPSTADADGIEVNYRYISDDLSNLTDTVDLPKELEYCPAVWAGWKLWEKRGKHSQAQKFKKEFYEQIKLWKQRKFMNTDSDFCMVGYTDDIGDKQELYGDV